MKFVLNKYKIEKTNAFLLTLFIFMSALSAPIIEITKSGIIIWILTIFILLLSIRINNYRFQFKFVIIVISIIILFITNMFFVDYKYEIIHILIEFLKFGAIPLYLALQNIDYKKMIEYWYIMGIINLIVWIIMIPRVDSGNISYMTMGIYLTYSFIIFTYYLYNLNSNKFINIILSLATFILIFFKSNRSSIIICVAIIIYHEVMNINRKAKLYTISKISLITLSMFILTNRIKEILLLINKIMLEIGIYSYSISKLVLGVEKGIMASSSGRDILYQESQDIIINSNFMPRGIGYFQYITGKVYPHNLFLDLFITFGIFSIVIILVSIIVFYIKTHNNPNIYLINIINMMTIFTIIRLNFSGMFWNEVPLWVLIGIIISIKIKSIQNY